MGDFYECHVCGHLLQVFENVNTDDIVFRCPQCGFRASSLVYVDILLDEVKRLRNAKTVTDNVTDGE